ncbi:pimeloyl-ACP methyl ester carboxylesterase [Nonomuraea thailandensis]|uniref:Pimeloyl-ACP methyl ester carboxylesterase n=1 Tax=Nonomuraea thailandensis TaxID=1188745 RepID=A0A9X2K4A2_9ACTN|nr:alpha/beta fold hydrolase [Nonomuraea thailandensis]MCP2359065.1 pimeloyl-ACP methyl ester carboxylesterase [Nonomuraea thailandensis]
MPIEFAHNGGVKLAYERMGPREGEPLLLIVGTALQMVAWADGLCAELGARGFAVVRYDNRDSGLSTRVEAEGASRRRPAYTLDDLADDAVAVMDALGWDSAHLFGAAAGGVIAQLTALRRPHRVRTLGLAASYAGWRLGRMRPGAILRMIGKGLRRPAPGREGYARAFVEAVRPLTTPEHPLDEEMWREIALTMFDRCPEPGPGSMRQAAALQAAGDLLPRLGGVTVPTLVIHGEADPVVRVRSAREIAAAVPGARLVLYPGMGHDLPRGLWPSIADELRALASGAATAQGPPSGSTA